MNLDMGRLAKTLGLCGLVVAFGACNDRQGVSGVDDFHERAKTAGQAQPYDEPGERAPLADAQADAAGDLGSAAGTGDTGAAVGASGGPMAPGDTDAAVGIGARGTSTREGTDDAESPPAGLQPPPPGALEGMVNAEGLVRGADVGSVTTAGAGQADGSAATEDGRQGRGQEQGVQPPGTTGGVGATDGEGDAHVYAEPADRIPRQTGPGEPAAPGSAERVQGTAYGTDASGTGETGATDVMVCYEAAEQRCWESRTGRCETGVTWQGSLESCRQQYR